MNGVTIATIDTSGLATPLAKGTTQISATYQSITGSSTLTVNPPPMYIFITSPVDGSTVNKSEITVTGTVFSQAKEVGITVNGIVANVTGNQFVANNIPLIEGDNVIVAKAIDSNGAVAEAKITVIAAPAANYITLTANIESGIPPLEVTLRIDGTFSIENSTLSVTGPAGPEVLYASIDEYKVVNGQVKTDPSGIKLKCMGTVFQKRLKEIKNSFLIRKGEKRFRQIAQNRLLRARTMFDMD